MSFVVAEVHVCMCLRAWEMLLVGQKEFKGLNNLLQGTISTRTKSYKQPFLNTNKVP